MKRLCVAETQLKIFQSLTLAQGVETGSTLELASQPVQPIGEANGDGSVGKGAGCRAWPSQFDPQGPPVEGEDQLLPVVL